jgi:hypothetical protein
MLDDVRRRRDGRKKAVMMSAVTGDTRTITWKYIMSICCSVFCLPKTAESSLTLHVTSRALVWNVG